MKMELVGRILSEDVHVGYVDLREGKKHDNEMFECDLDTGIHFGLEIITLNDLGILGEWGPVDLP